MGHYLDLLLPIKVQDDGEELPIRGVLNFVGFTISDDGTTITIEGEAGGGSNVTSAFAGGDGTTHKTLPVPSEGKIVIYAGGNLVIHPNAGEMINDAAGDYTLPLNQAIAIAVAGQRWDDDDFNWRIRTFSDEVPDGGGGGEPEPAIVWSPVDTLRVGNTDSPAGPYDNFTVGTAFFIRPGTPVNITGVRFFWAGLPGDVKTVLYSAAGAVIKTATVTTTAEGVYEAYFSAPYPIIAGIGGFQTKHIVSVYHGTSYTRVYNNSPAALLTPALPFFGGRRIGWAALGLYGTGDALPTNVAGSHWYLVEPIIEET
jgi:hypothetical protein